MKPDPRAALVGGWLLAGLLLAGCEPKKDTTPPPKPSVQSGAPASAPVR